MVVEQIGSSAATTAPPLVAANPRAAVPAAESQITRTDDTKPVQPAQAAPSLGEVHDAVKKIEQVVSPAAQDLRFSIDEDTGITVVKLIDTQTQTVLRQIPTVEVMEISKALDKLQGLLVREKA